MLVFAHGIVGRADLPIPEALFGVAAAAVLVVSFVALAAGWSTPRLQEFPERRLCRLCRLPVAVGVVLGAGPMTVPPFAHAGHWLAQLAYLLPLAVLVVLILAGKRRERRERREDERPKG